MRKFIAASSLASFFQGSWGSYAKYPLRKLKTALSVYSPQLMV